MNEIISKLDYEWERFFLDNMRTSKESIFARSDEITMKRRIIENLRKRNGKFSEEDKKKILSVTNVVEAAYRYVMDHKNNESSLADLLCSWVQSMQDENSNVQGGFADRPK